MIERFASDAGKKGGEFFTPSPLFLIHHSFLDRYFFFR
nr:hypothetical protein [Aliibacillus thermotolerans]